MLIKVFNIIKKDHNSKTIAEKGQKVEKSLGLPGR